MNKEIYLNALHSLNALGDNLLLVFPELVLALGIVVILVVDLLLPKQRKYYLEVVVVVVLSVVFGLILNQYLSCSCQQKKVIWDELLYFDAIGISVKLILVIASLLCFILFWVSPFKHTMLQQRAELYTVILSIQLAAHIMVMSIHWMMVFLSLEMMSIGAYILVFFAYDKKSVEGSIKYLLYGAIASGIMLYGISWLYGLSGGHLGISVHEYTHLLLQAPPALLWMAIFFILSGLFFKMALVPFHIWVPDVYEAAPSPVVAFLTIVPKVAAMTVLFRIAQGFVLAQSSDFVFGLTLLIAVLGIVALIVGNFAALRQNNFKRLMGYSAIAQAPFLMIVVLNPTLENWKNILFFLINYTVAVYLFFFLLDKVAGFIELQKKEDPYHLRNYFGLGIQYPWLGVAFTIALLSLIGLPPTMGFIAKLLLFFSLWSFYQESHFYVLYIYLLVALFATAVSLAYYLKIPYVMYLKTPVMSKDSNVILWKWQEIVLISLLSGMILLFFFRANWIFELLKRIEF